MLCVWACSEKSLSAVRFVTEKNIEFPRLNAIFDRAVDDIRRTMGGPSQILLAG